MKDLGPNLRPYVPAPLGAGIRRIIVLLLYFVLLDRPAAEAGSIRQFLDDAILEIENPTAVESQERNFLWGGGLHLRTPQMNFQPFHVAPPRLKAGCGGIDIAFGGFDYFNRDYLVDFGERVVASAPAFSVNMAMATMCEQCETIMNKMTALGNAINSINLDSCQAAKLVGRQVGQWVGETVNDNLIGGGESSWLRAASTTLSDATTAVQGWNRALRNAGCDPESDPRCASYNYRESLLVRTLQDTYYNDTATLYYLRYLIGDIYPAFPEGGSNRAPVLIPLSGVPLTENGHLEEMISRWIWGNTPGSCDQEAVFVPGISVISGTHSETTIELDTLCGRVDEQLGIVTEKIADRVALEEEELAFLGAFRAPVYKLINVLSVDPVHLTTIQTDLTRMLATELAYEVLSSVAKEFYRGINKLESASANGPDLLTPEEIERLKSRMGELTRAAYKISLSELDQFQRKLDAWKNLVNLEARLKGQMLQHPVLGAYYFSKGLVKAQ